MQALRFWAPPNPFFSTFESIKRGWWFSECETNSGKVKDRGEPGQASREGKGQKFWLSLKGNDPLFQKQLYDNWTKVLK